MRRSFLRYAKLGNELSERTAWSRNETDSLYRPTTFWVLVFVHNDDNFSMFLDIDIVISEFQRKGAHNSTCKRGVLQFCDRRKRIDCGRRGEHRIQLCASVDWTCNYVLFCDDQKDNFASGNESDHLNNFGCAKRKSRSFASFPGLPPTARKHQ